MLFSCNIPGIIEINGTTMGTSYNINIFDELSGNRIKILYHRIDSVLEQVNNQFSTFKPDSEISKINKSKTNAGIRLSNDFSSLLFKCIELNNKSNGYFDPTVSPLVEIWGFGVSGVRAEPPADSVVALTLEKVGLSKIRLDSDSLFKLNTEVELDFSAIAKGWGVDQISLLLENELIFNFMVEIGGEVRCSGSNAGNPWKIGISYPIQQENYKDVIEVLYLNNQSIATSGDYRNYFEYNGKKFSHTINPKTGYPVNHALTSVTIIAPNCTLADGLATAVMALGVNAGIDLVENYENTEGLLLELHENEIIYHKTSNIDKFILNF